MFPSATTMTFQMHTEMVWDIESERKIAENMYVFIHFEFYTISSHREWIICV